MVVGQRRESHGYNSVTAADGDIYASSLVCQPTVLPLSRHDFKHLKSLDDDIDEVTLKQTSMHYFMYMHDG